MYRLGNFSGFNVPKLRGEHSLFDGNSVRVKLNIVPTGDFQMINVASDPNGDTIYLPYFVDEISSVRLPFPAPAGVVRFLTDGLSGCRIYVDEIDGSQDIIAYHANARMYSPPGNLSGTQPAFEPTNAGNHMDGLHARAQGDYRAAPYNLNVQDSADLNKTEYNKNPAAEVLRKNGQGRNNVEFLGGTVVVGFYSAVGWEFYYQTFGGLDYDRPWYAPKRYVDDKQHRGLADMDVLGTGQFY
jgi:hypothetical protein